MVSEAPGVGGVDAGTRRETIVGLIAAATAHRGRGRFWDLGAGAGARDRSFTRALIDRGWTGLAIEPSPSLFERLHAEYLTCRAVELIHAAIGLEHRFATYFDSRGELYGTTDPELAEKWLRAGIAYAPYLVPLVTVRELIDTFAGAPNVVAIDVPGLSFRILQQIPVRSWDADVLVVAHEGRAVEISEWGRTKHYTTGHVDGSTVLLVHRNLGLFKGARA